MGSSAIKLLLLALSASSATVRAAPHEVRNDNVCARGLYGELVPFLEHYAYAKQWCAAVYPSKCSAKQQRQKRTARVASSSSTSSPAQATVATTTTTVVQSTKGNANPAVTPTITSANGGSRVNAGAQSSSTAQADVAIAAFSKANRQGAAFLSTLCSCINPAQVSHREFPLSSTILISYRRERWSETMSFLLFTFSLISVLSTGIVANLLE